MVFYQRVLLVVKRFVSRLIFLHSVSVLGPRDESIHHFLSSNLPLRACMLSRFSHVQLFVTLWTVAHQAPLSLEFSRQEHWSGFPCPPPGIFATHGSNLHLLLYKQILYCWAHQGSPKSSSTGWHMVWRHRFYHSDHTPCYYSAAHCADVKEWLPRVMCSQWLSEVILSQGNVHCPRWVLGMHPE